MLGRLRYPLFLSLVLGLLGCALERLDKKDQGPSDKGPDAGIVYDSNGVTAQEVYVTVSGSTATGTYTVLTNRAVTFRELVLAVRDASNANRDFIWNGDVTVTGSQTFTGSRSSLADGTYTAVVAYTLDGSRWFEAGPKISFLVGSACAPTTCAAQGKDCDTISDGCGGTLSCGSCTAPETCGGGGVANVCGGGGGGGGNLAPPPGYIASQLIFEETFDSPSLDTTKWNPWLGDDNFGRWNDQGALPSPYSGMNCNSTCSNSYQIQYYDPYPYGGGTNIDGDHLVGGDGKLALIAKPGNHFSSLGYSWSSSAITTFGKAYLPAEGGYVQIRAKMPDSRYGAWAGLWLLSANGAEMDIQESGYPHGGANVNNVLASNWQGGGSQNVQDTGKDLSADYHVYGVEYLPGQSWKVYLDGQMLATWTSGVPTNAPYQLLIDVEIAGPNAAGWHTVADPVGHAGPFVLEIDEVQIYRR